MCQQRGGRSCCCNCTLHKQLQLSHTFKVKTKTSDKCVRNWFELIGNEKTNCKTSNSLVVQRLQCTSYRFCNDFLLIQYLLDLKLLSQSATISFTEKKSLSTSSFPDCIDLFWREYLFLACRASERLHVMQDNAVKFQIKLHFNEFNTARWAKQSVCLSEIWFIGRIFFQALLPKPQP